MRSVRSVCALSILYWLSSCTATTVLSDTYGGSLGPVRLCRCYEDSIVPTAHDVVMRQNGFSSAQICHCIHQESSSEPTIPTPTLTSTPSSSPSPAPPLFTELPVDFHDACLVGLRVKGQVTSSDGLDLHMCSHKVLSSFSPDVTVLSLEESRYPCGTFRFSVRNFLGASGLAFHVIVNGYKFSAVGIDKTTGDWLKLPEEVTPLRTYATWVFQTCDEVTMDMMKPAVIVSQLKNKEGFKNMTKDMAFPVGVQDGDVYPGGLQCVFVENPWCWRGGRSKKDDEIK